MKYALLALLLVAFNASATKTNEGCQGNCPSTGGGTTNNEANSNATGGHGGNGYGGSGGDSSSVGVGVGVGIGLGQGGAGGEGGRGGSGGDGGSGVGFGGAGGHGGSVDGSGNSANLNNNTAKGGDASQGQLQGQHQSSASVSGSKSIAQQALENSNKINASSSNQNQSSASGNHTSVKVGGDSTLVERNAPPVFLGAITPTNCGGSVQAGGSGLSGAGAFGISYVGRECEKRMVADRFQQYGQVDVSCRIMKTTKAFKAAVKDDPTLANVDCSMKAPAAPVPVLVAPELAPRIPRG